MQQDQITVDAGSLSFDRGEYKRLWMDTPLNPPYDPLKRRALAPGTCVKTKRGEVCGRVHSNPNRLDGECIVIGHGWENWDSERFVWRGTKRDFELTWNID